QKLAKYELKPENVHVTFSAERHRKKVEMHIFGRDVSMTAKSFGESFYEAVDLVVDKLYRQMKKHKQKVKSHRSMEKTKRHRSERWMERMERELQPDSVHFPIEYKKTG
ncbi:MAG: ribosome-associated translation inhibitor RaiA, partial [Bdellovibrionales bacterium]|nr:ribosome-associated translation inhibitor RaiA [Bdellovibrionales bacterium]